MWNARKNWGWMSLVHGEPERNDMVEYFGEQLAGFAFTRNGWVQSYGTRCVKPPVIFGDVWRPGPMTVDWIRYAQGLTDKPMKGIVTGPVTILQWSFVRDDQPRSETAMQIALAMRDEVLDLEAAGIRVIQIDEPAFREGLPLRRSEWASLLALGGPCIPVAAAGVQDGTQIHTHMCYAEFNDIFGHRRSGRGRDQHRDVAVQHGTAGGVPARSATRMRLDLAYMTSTLLGFQRCPRW